MHLFELWRIFCTFSFEEFFLEQSERFLNLVFLISPIPIIKPNLFLSRISPLSHLILCFCLFHRLSMKCCDIRIFRYDLHRSNRREFEQHQNLFFTYILSALCARFNRIRSAEDIRTSCMLSISSLSFTSGTVGVNFIVTVLNTIVFGRSFQRKMFDQIICFFESLTG